MTVWKLQLVKEKEVHYGEVSCVSNAADIFRELGVHAQPEETFWMLTMNAKGRAMGAHQVSQGELTSTVVHPREVFKRAILENACSIIVAHNHPSGVADPSKEDEVLTERLVQVGKLIGIKVVDHIILAGDEHFSFAGNGLINN